MRVSAVPPRSQYKDSGKGVTVTLHWKEMEHAVLAGGHRNIRAIEKGVPQSRGRSENDNWTSHVEGAGGEIAASKVLDIYWEMGESKTDASGLEIRTMSQTHYGLLVRPQDIQRDYTCVLVVGCMPKFRVVGWIMARDAKRDEWLFDPSSRGAPCYLVPQEELLPIERLQRILQLEKSME